MRGCGSSGSASRGGAAAQRVGWRTRTLAWLRGDSGPRSWCRRSMLEQADAGSYDTQPEAAGTPLPAEERSHARSCWPSAVAARRAYRDRPWPASRAATAPPAATRCAPPCWAPTTACVSNFSLVMGVAGRSAGQHADPAHRPGRAAGRRRLDGAGRMDLGAERARAVRPPDRDRARGAGARSRTRSARSWR